MVPTGETNWSFRSLYPDVLARGRTNTLSGTLQNAGTAPTITAATFHLYRPDGVEVTGCTLSLASNVATVTVPAASLPATLTLGEGYQEVWTFTVGGVEYSYQRPAALALYQLVPAIHQSDVSGSTGRQPSLARNLGAGVTVQSFMDQAWGQIVRKIIAAGHLPYLIRTPDALGEAHICLTLALAYEGMAAGSDNATYAKLAATYREQWGKEWGAVNWQTDYDHTGKITDPSQRQISRGGVMHAWGTVGAVVPRGF
jgi:hypothetical protein